jgi:hypothetical protein
MKIRLVGDFFKTNLRDRGKSDIKLPYCKSPICYFYGAFEWFAPRLP